VLLLPQFQPPLPEGFETTAAVEATFEVAGFSAATFVGEARADFVRNLAAAVGVDAQYIDITVTDRDARRRRLESGINVVASIQADTADVAASVEAALAVDMETLAATLDVTLTAPVATKQVTIVLAASPPPPMAIVDGSASAQEVAGDGDSSGATVAVVITVVVVVVAVIVGLFVCVRMKKMKAKPSVVLGSPMPVQCNIADVSSTTSATNQVEMGAAPEVVVDDDESKI